MQRSPSSESRGPQMEKEGFLCTSSNGKEWKKYYLSVKGLYLKLSEAKDGLPDKPVLRSKIKAAEQYDTADACKFKVEFNKGSKPIFLKAYSEEEAKKWIDVLNWNNSVPPPATQPGHIGNPPPYDEPAHQSSAQPAIRSKLCIII